MADKDDNIEKTIEIKIKKPKKKIRGSKEIIFPLSSNKSGSSYCFKDQIDYNWQTERKPLKINRKTSEILKLNVNHEDHDENEDHEDHDIIINEEIPNDEVENDEDQNNISNNVRTKRKISKMSKMSKMSKISKISKHTYDIDNDSIIRSSNENSSIIESPTRLIRGNTIINHSAVSNNLLKLSSHSSLPSLPFIMNSQKTYGIKTQYAFENTKYFKDIKIEETKYCEFIYDKYKFNAICQGILVIISVFSSIMGVEIQRKYEDIINLPYQYLYLKQMEACYVMCSVSSLFLWILMILDHFYYYDVVFQQIKISDSLTRKQPKAVIEIIIRLIICLPHPNHFLIGLNYKRYNEKYDVVLTYSYNSLLMVICTLRILLLVQFYLINSNFFSPQSKRICEINKINSNNLFFTLKASMQGSSIQIYGLIFCVLIFFFCISVRNFEMVLDEQSGKKFLNFSDVLWGILITMLTVGFGDIYPSTFEGRLLCIASGVIGICLNSLLMVALTNLANIEGHERNVYTLLERLQIKDEQKAFSTKLLKSYFNLYRTMRAKEPDIRIKDKLRERFLVSLLNYEDNNKELDNTFPSISNFEVLSMDIGSLNDKMCSNDINVYKIREELDKTMQII